MKQRIKIRLLMMWVMLLAGIPFKAVFATEVPITGTELVYCNVAFNIVDESGAFKEPVEVTFTDIAAGKTYNYTLTYANSYGRGDVPKFTVQANTTYTIEIGINEAYSVVNQDGTAIGKFGASESGHDFKWKIIANQGPQENSPEIISIGNAEGDELFKKCYEVMKGMQDDPDWEMNAQWVEAYAKQDAEAYVKYAQGTKEEWMAMDTFDKYIYFNTYLIVARCMGSGNYSEYFGSEKNYVENAIRYSLSILEDYDEEIQQAYKDLMMWQYNYIQEHHSPYNFFTGKTYLETMGSVPDSEVLAAEQLEQEKKEIEEARKELLDDPEVAAELEEVMKEIEEEQAPEKEGIWDGVIKTLKNNIVTIIIMIVALLSIGGIMLYRKKVNYSDMD